MKKEYFLSFIILGFGVVVSIVLIGNAQAQAPADEALARITFPIKELGNCENKEACKAYCDISEHVAACVAFAEKNNLFPKEQLEMAKKWVEAGSKGPGGCYGQKACDEYCQDISHMDECIAFAEKVNLMRPQELVEAKKVQAAIKRGVKMPACKNKKECDVYCEAPEHMEECLTFAQEAGFISGSELENAQKVLVAVKKGIKPPPCKGKEACDEYCSAADHIEECIIFAEAAGLMSKEEKTRAKQVLKAIKKGIKPPPCKSKEACDKYCSQEEHFDECLNFAQVAGLMKPEEAEMAKKTRGKGPGGCRGKEECDVFCQKPENQETCFNFAKEHELIPEEDLQKMQEGMAKMQEGLKMAPSQVVECLKSTVGTENYEKMQAGTLTPGPRIGEQIRGCFEQFMPKPAEGMKPPKKVEFPEGMRPPEGMMVPGFKQIPEGLKEIPEQFKQMMPEQLRQMTPEQLKQITPEQIQQMMPPGMQLPTGMQPPTGTQMMPEQLRQMTPEQLKQITPEQIQQMIPEQFKQMMPPGMQLPSGMPSPPGMMQPPTGMQPPLPGMQPPTMMQPPTEMPPPPGMQPPRQPTPPLPRM